MKIFFDIPAKVIFTTRSGKSYSVLVLSDSYLYIPDDIVGIGIHYFSIPD